MNIDYGNGRTLVTRSITAGTTPQIVMGANSQTRNLVIQNKDFTTSVFLSFSAASPSSSTSIEIPPRSMFTFDADINEQVTLFTELNTANCVIMQTFGLNMFEQGLLGVFQNACVRSES